MPTNPGRVARLVSEEFAEIMNTIFGDQSQVKLQMQSHGEISGPTFGRLRLGKPGTEVTLRRLAHHFLEPLITHYGEEIREAYGHCDTQAAGDWLCQKAGFSPTPQHITIEAPDDQKVLALRGYAGAADLPTEDLNTLHALITTFVAERRRARGLD